MKVTLLKSLLLVGLAASCFNANAHRAWIVPQETQLSGENSWVSFDAAVSNDIFVSNYNAGRFTGVKVNKPDGSATRVENIHKGKYRHVFDLALNQQGTYKIFMETSGLYAQWKENGEPKWYPGRGEAFSMAEFEKRVPKKADDLNISQYARRMETFVTLGAPTNKTLEPTNKGLELVAITHPNELYAGEEAQFKFLIDGKPAVGAEITAIQEGTRFRDAQEEIKVKSNSEGIVTLKWNGAGRYFLEAEYEDSQAKAPAMVRNGTYIAVLEVLPD